MIKKELSSNTFAKVNRSEYSIIDEHKTFLLKYGIKFDDDNSQLPYLYITPKQHKKPVALIYYITSGSVKSLQQLCVYLSVCLKSMLQC